MSQALDIDVSSGLVQPSTPCRSQRLSPSCRGGVLREVLPLGMHQRWCTKAVGRLRTPAELRQGQRLICCADLSLLVVITAYADRTGTDMRSNVPRAKR